MNRSRMASIVLGLTVGMCWCAAGMGTARDMKSDQPLLDGKSYTGTLTSQADGKTYDEGIMFEKGMIRSTACEARGFKGGPYTAVKADGKTTVKGSVTNDKGESNVIDATIEGDMLTGTLTAKKADGTVADTMTLKAKKSKKMPEGEHPAKPEQPKAEHPEHPR